MPRILITANTSWYLHNFRSNLIRALQAEGHEVIAVAPRDEYSERLPCAFEHIGIDQGGTNPLRDLRTAFDFWRLYRRLRPDVVLNFTPKNNIYSSLAAARLGLVFIEEGLTARITRGVSADGKKKGSDLFLLLVS